MARCMTMAGVRRGMLVHNANTYGLFTGGHGFHQGAERIGAPVVPVSGGFTARQAMLLHDLGAQVLVATPSYALVIAQAVHDAGIDPATLRLELGLFGGEPWTDGLREEIERALPGLRAVNFYGLSEMCGPGVAAECLEARDGLHVHEDHFLVEVVDPESGVPLDEGAEGELVFTTLVEGGDAAAPLPHRRHRLAHVRAVPLRPDDGADPRPARPARRHDHRARRQRVPLERRARAPSVPEAAPHYQLVVERDGAMDELTVQCEPAARTSIARPADRASSACCASTRHPRPRRRARARAGAAQRGQGRARRRPARLGVIRRWVGLAEVSPWATSATGSGASCSHAERASGRSGGMGAGGFEPPKAEPTGLQPVPFGRSGTPPGERDCSRGRVGYLQNVLTGVARSQRYPSAFARVTVVR